METEKREEEEEEEEVKDNEIYFDAGIKFSKNIKLYRVPKVTV